ncbi:hypothetical protein NpPPO83_00002761 [Neofusicoccum parvum]|uniref:Uncharacterized protein n=1 Tax=Neofusicoccum parvum TaxID=310453 RepID=A0ACB5RZF0_9PEZI|nr:hypothetical protein NpPPO83_00002761 [Neofusicoccum parvum]
MIIDSKPVHIHDRAKADTEKPFESEYLPQRMVQPQSVLVVQAQTPTKDPSHSTAKHQSTKPALSHILDSEESACTEFNDEPPMTFPVIVCRDDKKAGGEEYLGQFNGTKSQQYLTAEFNISNRNKAFLRLCLDPLVVDTNRTFSFKSTSRISLIITLDNLISKRSMALKKANEDEMPEYISEQLHFKQSAIGNAEVPNARFLSVSLKDYLTIVMPRKPGRLANDDELEYILRFRELSVTKCFRL